MESKAATTASTSAAATSASGAAVVAAGGINAQDEDDNFRLDEEEDISCTPGGCGHEGMSRTELRRATKNPETHMLMVYQERCTTARQNQIHKLRAEQLEMRQIIKDLKDRLTAVEKDAKVACICPVVGQKLL